MQALSCKVFNDYNACEFDLWNNRISKYFLQLSAAVRICRHLPRYCGRHPISPPPSLWSNIYYFILYPSFRRPCSGRLFLFMGAYDNDEGISTNLKISTNKHKGKGCRKSTEGRAIWSLLPQVRTNLLFIFIKSVPCKGDTTGWEVLTKG